MKTLNMIALVILMIGGLNWGAVGLFHTDVVAMFLGAGTMASTIVYTIVGVAALYGIALFRPLAQDPKYTDSVIVLPQETVITRDHKSPTYSAR